MVTKRIGVYGLFPYVSGVPASTDYSDEFLRWLFDRDAVLSLRRYWRDVSGGELDVEASIFGFELIDGQSFIDRLCLPKRRGPAAFEAVQLLYELDHDPSPYDGLVFVIVGAGAVDGGATYVQFGDRPVPVCYFDDRGSHSFMAHELGHLLGLSHSFNTSAVNPTYQYGEYADPTCIMSAENFGNVGVTFEIPAGSRLFAASSSKFWKSAGTGVAMASLWRYLPGYPAAQSFSTQLPPLSPPTPVRLNRAGSTGLRLVTMPVAGPNSWYMAEYRPAVQWDRGLPTASAGTGATAGVVIHQIRRAIGTVADGATGADWPRIEAVNFVATIPLPSTGDLDWSDANFGVRVVAYDVGWVDLIVGASLPADQSVRLSAESDATFAYSVPGESVEVPRTGSDCGTHTYTAMRSSYSVEINAEVISSGFVAPRFRYELNGVALNAWTGPTDTFPGAKTLSVSVKVPASLTSHVVATRMVNVSFTASANKIKIDLPPGDGSYDISLVGFVADNPTPGVIGIASAAIVLPVTTASMRLPPQAIADQGRCIARMADELRQRRRWPPDEEHPDWRPPTHEEAWSPADLATLGKRVLAVTKFERLYPAMGVRAVADLAAQLGSSVSDVRGLAERLSRRIDR
jgi:hypothetical protein